MQRQTARILSQYLRATHNAITSGGVRRYCVAQSIPPLKLTTPCVERIKELEKQRKSTVVLRVTVDAGGCSGFQYCFQLENWDSKPQKDNLKNEEDVLIEQEGAFVIIDDLSLGFMSGSKVDYTQELIGSSFRVTENPKSESSCGCGTSFFRKL